MQLKGKSLGRKLFIMVQLSPAFILSLAFKVSGIVIICALLKEYAVEGRQRPILQPDKHPHPRQVSVSK